MVILVSTILCAGCKVKRLQNISSDASNRQSRPPIMERPLMLNVTAGDDKAPRLSALINNKPHKFNRPVSNSKKTKTTRYYDKQTKPTHADAFPVKNTFFSVRQTQIIKLKIFYNIYKN